MERRNAVTVGFFRQGMKHYKRSFLLLLLMLERDFNRLGHGSVVEKIEEEEEEE